MRKILFILAALAAGTTAMAQSVTEDLLYNNDYLDTVVVFRQQEINNYTMIGVSYGEVISRMTITPYAHQENLWNPGHIALTFTHYEKMFDYLPYFGFQTGVAYSYEGMRFKKNEESGWTPSWENGENQFLMRIVEVPLHAQLHFDAPPIKFMANIGIYGAYRLDIHRQGINLNEEYEFKFRDYNKRFDYGLEGGAGIAFMVDPVEFHINALVRYGWGSFFEPDYYSEYYYRYAYPFDIMLTFGVHFQLSKRKGKTLADIKEEARRIVYGE